ncbi:hypothetical protein SAMN04489725_11620 [Alicyclobacillus hesperidum]|uniref:Uncharacterized protein n=1 Tax=Alicyclobacillus hesperidum TaxID=89784 RepID=A0A1H2WNY4_9BACL|nr:hypothetical protein SAMN04489725_11620 [Alicyclobacillus hesperidum]
MHVTITETEKVMENDPRGLWYLYPSIPPLVMMRKLRKFYENLVTASVVDTLRASGKVAISRNFFTQKRRLELAERRIKIGRRAYYVVDRTDVPRRARKLLRDGWPIVEYEVE